MKNISELTYREAEDLLHFVYPELSKGSFCKIRVKPEESPNGGVYITMGGGDGVGVEYLNDHCDKCVLHFDDTRAVLWLYRHGYDIEKQLVNNSYLSEMESDFNALAYGLHYYIEDAEKNFIEERKQNYTLEYTRKKASELLDTYYYKDYPCYE